ncbi:MAG: hypothetical protein OEZ38_10075, partial [Gammaproteobacteria bacterium]|nr:hypothetical protein [Gammaproteobacteria bacterium]
LHEQMEAQLGKVISTDSEIQFSWFEITNDSKQPIKLESTTSNKITSYILMIILVSILLFALIGFIFSINWLFN